MASELHPWRFKLEIFPSWLPCEHVFEPKLNAQLGAICETFFSKCFEQSTSRCLVPTSLWLGPIDSLPFVTVIFCFCFVCFLKKSMKRKLLCQLFTATNCNTFTWHALKLTCQTTFNSILFKALLSHAGQLSCCDIMEVTWLKHRIFICRRCRCSMRHVCFHSNQYFYVPHVNLSNEQRVC